MLRGDEWLRAYCCTRWGFFFFSSRRRHTRCSRDWSSDVCSSDLYFAWRGLAFRTRVFDLGMMGYGLVGARVHRLDGRPSALFAYRGVGDHTLMCQMFEGSLDELPQGGEAREHNGIEFRIFKEHGLTLVFWMEGSVVCVLVSDVSGEDVVQLAYAKAVKV